MKKRILFILTGAMLLSAVYCQSDDAEKKIMKPALLVVDVQKKFVPMMSKEDQEMALEMMNWSIWLFRQYDLPVIRIYHTSEKWGPEPGTEGFAFHDSLKVKETDPMVIKTYGSGFNKTELNEKLQELGVNTLFICGLSSTGCVLATYLDAQNYDYDAFMIKDALLGPNADQTNQIETIFDALDLNTINYMMEIRQE